MRIVHLDEPTFLPERWCQRFAALGEFEVFRDRPDPELAVRRLSETDLAIIEWTPLTAEMLGQLTRLRYVTLVTTGHDSVDLQAAHRAGITVAHCPMYARQAVAEHVFALLLALCRRLPEADAAVRAGAAHLYRPFLGTQLGGKTLGLLGMGRTASAVASVAKGFGMRVIATNASGRQGNGLTRVPLEVLLRESDFVSIHLPHVPATRRILDARRLAMLKPSAILINTCRADLIDQEALGDLLASGRLAGAGLDDLTEPGASRLRALPNVILSPGTAWYTDVARELNLEEVYANVESYLAGAPRNVLTGPI